MTWSEHAAFLLSLIVPPKGRALCEQCGGSGSVGTEQRPTDFCRGAGEVQWRGYIPTNFCHDCNGTGWWPPLEEGRR